MKKTEVKKLFAAIILVASLTAGLAGCIENDQFKIEYTSADGSPIDPGIIQVRGKMGTTGRDGEVLGITGEIGPCTNKGPNTIVCTPIVVPGATVIEAAIIIYERTGKKVKGADEVTLVKTACDNDVVTGTIQATYSYSIVKNSVDACLFRFPLGAQAIANPVYYIPSEDIPPTKNYNNKAAFQISCKPDPAYPGSCGLFLGWGQTAPKMLVNHYGEWLNSTFTISASSVCNSWWNNALQVAVVDNPLYSVPLLEHNPTGRVTIIDPDGSPVPVEPVANDPLYVGTPAAMQINYCQNNVL